MVLVYITTGLFILLLVYVVVLWFFRDTNKASAIWIRGGGAVLEQSRASGTFGVGIRASASDGSECIGSFVIASQHQPKLTTTEPKIAGMQRKKQTRIPVQAPSASVIRATSMTRPSTDWVHVEGFDLSTGEPTEVDFQSPNRVTVKQNGSVTQRWTLLPTSALQFGVDV